MDVEIRGFADRDRPAMLEVFDRAGHGAPTASLWRHRESEAAIYLTPYMDQESGSLLLAVVDGSIVGYLAGCDDDSRFPSESERMNQAFRRYRLWQRPKAVAFFARALFDMAVARVRHAATAGELIDPRWPAHLHINVAPEARGTGAAQALMQRWFDHLADTGSPGCYLQTIVENPRAVAFFERMGFVRIGSTPVVPGARYEGRRVHQLTMTWTPTDSTS